jgi:DNA-binding response OmpR family regulator
MKILIIDNDQALLNTYSEAFKEEAFEVITALTGQDGLIKAKEPGVSLILSGEVLPDISGNEILKKLKLDSQTNLIPVIILSNFSQEELVNEAIAQGAEDYIFKFQVDTNDIVRKIKERLIQNNSKKEDKEDSQFDNN